MGFPKALCLLGQSSFLQSIVETLTACQVHHIVVVVGAQAERVIKFHLDHGLSNVHYVLNPDWQTTYMLESLRCGLKHVPLDHAVLHWPVDCVDVHPHDLSALLKSKSPLSALVYDNKLAHPMRISADAVGLLRDDAQNFASLRDFVAKFDIEAVPTKFRALMNCNTPEHLRNYMQNALLDDAH